jgi:hypothetical protein
MTLRLTTTLLILLLSWGTAQAVPWCWRGTILEIQDVTWTETEIMMNFSGPIPAGVYDDEYYTTFTATHNYAATFAGGGGGFGGYSVPGSGQVKVQAYAPNSYVNMVGPGNYFTSDGVQFKLLKCYTVPPLTTVVDFATILEPDGPPIQVRPFEGLGNLRNYRVFLRDQP